MFYDITGTLKNGNHAKLRNLIQQQPLITSFHLPIFFRPIMTCVMLSWSDCAVTLSLPLPGSLPPGLLPPHKASVIMFLERVYGIQDQATFFRLLEDCILSDLRAATTLDMVGCAAVLFVLF